MLGVTLIVGLGSLNLRQSIALSTTIAEQNAMKARIAKEERATTEQRELLANTLKTINDRVFALKDRMTEADKVVEARAENSLDRHISRGHR